MLTGTGNTATVSQATGTIAATSSAVHSSSTATSSALHGGLSATRADRAIRAGGASTSGHPDRRTGPGISVVMAPGGTIDPSTGATMAPAETSAVAGHVTARSRDAARSARHSSRSDRGGRLTDRAMRDHVSGDLITTNE